MSDIPTVFDTDENAKTEDTTAKVEDEKQDSKQPKTVRPVLRPSDQETEKIIPKTISAWRGYYDQMGVERQKIVQTLSKQAEFEIKLRNFDGDGNELEPQTVIYKRRRLSVKEYFDMEAMRDDYNNFVPKTRTEARDAMVDLYKTLAPYLLVNATTKRPMSEEEFWRCHWFAIKLVIDAIMLPSATGLEDF